MASLGASSGQQLTVQVETGDNWCPSGDVSGSVLFTIFINHLVRLSAPTAGLQMTPS